MEYWKKAPEVEDYLRAYVTEAARVGISLESTPYVGEDLTWFGVGARVGEVYLTLCHSSGSYDINRRSGKGIEECAH